MKGKFFCSGLTVCLKRFRKLHLSASSESRDVCQTAHFSTQYFTLAKMIQKLSVERWTLHTLNEHCIRDVADVA